MQSQALRTITMVLILFGVFQMGFTQTGAHPFFWKKGPQIASSKSSFRGKFGGRILLDYAHFRQQGFLETEFGRITDDFEWRRLRAYHSGGFRHFKYKIQVEFSGKHMMLEDVYIEWTDIPTIGRVRIGHMKEPFLLEMLSSSKYVVFMERGVTTMFSSGRNLGVMLANRIGGSDYYWSAGAFRNGDFDLLGKSAQFGYNFIWRVSGLVKKNKTKTNFIHLGFGFKHSTFENDILKVSSRPEAHLAEKYISSGTITGVRNMTALSSDLVLQAGRASFQAEAVVTAVNTDIAASGGIDHAFSAAMAQFSYFLTRDTRNYKNGNTGFVRINPNRSLLDGGIGAVEIAARVSTADLRTGLDNCQRFNNYSLGINWWPNYFTRLSTNYVHSQVIGMGNSNIFETRIQFAI